MKPKTDKGFFALMGGILVLIFTLFFVGKLFEGSTSKTPLSFEPFNTNETQDIKVIENPITGIAVECPNALYDGEKERIQCSAKNTSFPIIIQTGENVSSNDFLTTAENIAQGIGVLGSTEDIGRYWGELLSSSSFKTDQGYDAASFQYKETIILENGKKIEGKSSVIYAVRTPTHDSSSRITFIYFETPWNNVETIQSEQESLLSVLNSLTAVQAKK